MSETSQKWKVRHVRRSYLAFMGAKDRGCTTLETATEPGKNFNFQDVVAHPISVKKDKACIWQDDSTLGFALLASPSAYPDNETKTRFADVSLLQAQQQRMEKMLLCLQYICSH
ncbi:uncharacterized protein PHALS_01125 [Plasmopara halstedii]|uniref:Uncharacterized protein n=1 Tax=Plasmopara halstedii TaxID=4781 RepID=A0A0P1AVZ7_PLAHL|nr:uncharacterized protein PHALS_01125 [Plasmopara halstedii]CEG44788.1 hypothetical protein PHALS_01125 [Plasmopara halstedii]|eukprot:XP_024581157.1 hypothetical protein PHALS_01125 [Plasmopara halstedii]